MTERVLVTGASGFIGHHLVRALKARGSRVIALVRKTSNVDELLHLEAELAYGDVTDYDSLVDPISGCAVVYHAAALTTALSLQELLHVNETGSRNVARACAQVDEPPVLVALSSLSAVGPSPDNTLLTEDADPEPISNYGRSKLAGEQAIASYASDLPVTIIRAGIVFGEFDVNVYKMFWWAEKGIHAIPVDGGYRHSLIHAADCAELMITAAVQGERVSSQTGYGRGYYHAACNIHPTYIELQELIAGALDRRRLIRIQFPRSIVLLIAAVLEGAARLFGRSPNIVNLDKAREGFAGSWICSPEKAALQLGFTPNESLEQRLQQTADWYRQQGWL